MDLREKSVHKSTGLDRDYFDGWKDKPLYISNKKGKALSRKGDGKSYANLRSFARDTLEQLKKNLGYLGSITDESISGDSEDISFTVRMRDERDFKRLQADVRNNQKDFNKIKGVSVPGYSLEYVEARTSKQAGIYRADFYYCFDWDSLDESRISMVGKAKSMKESMYTSKKMDVAKEELEDFLEYDFSPDVAKAIMEEEDGLITSFLSEELYYANDEDDITVAIGTLHDELKADYTWYPKGEHKASKDEYEIPLVDGSTLVYSGPDVMDKKISNSQDSIHESRQNFMRNHRG